MKTVTLMDNNEHLEKITKKLLSFGDRIDPAVLFPTLHPEAGEFAIQNPFALALAISLDRGTKADIIWTIPYDLYQHLGHLDPEKINQLSLEELESIFFELPRKPRYVNDAPRTVKELTRLVVKEFGGDTSGMWYGKSASEVKNSFQSVYGVGPGIANMSVLLIEKAYGIRFSDLDRKGMDIKADVHTMRVLYRLGASDHMSEPAAVNAARKMHPDYPGEIDAPLWVIGRRWCHAQGPDCNSCPMDSLCPKVGL